MITRHTTPSQQLAFPSGTFDNAIEVFVMYKQKAKRIIKKWYGNGSPMNVGTVYIDDDVITITLSEEETAEFRDEFIATVQVKWKTDDGDKLSSDIVPFDVGEILSDENLTYEPTGPTLTSFMIGDTAAEDGAITVTAGEKIWKAEADEYSTVEEIRIGDEIIPNEYAVDLAEGEYEAVISILRGRVPLDITISITCEGSDA